MEVLKPTIFNRSFETLFLKLKKILENTLFIDGLAEETITLNKRLNRNFNSE